MAALGVNWLLICVPSSSREPHAYGPRWLLIWGPISLQGAPAGLRVFCWVLKSILRPHVFYLPHWLFTWGPSSSNGPMVFKQPNLLLTQEPMPAPGVLRAPLTIWGSCLITQSPI